MTFQNFPNFLPIFISTGAFWSASVDPPFKESTDSGLSEVFFEGRHRHLMSCNCKVHPQSNQTKSKVLIKYKCII